MNYKKIILVISFLAIFSFVFNFSAPSAQAMTVPEMQAMIQRLTQQVIELQRLLLQMLQLQRDQLQQQNVTPIAPTLTPPTTPVSVITLTASPTTVISGQRTTLTWRTTNTDSCTATHGPGFNTGGSVSGRDDSDPLTSSADFTILCIDKVAGPISKSVRVNVTPATTITQPPVITSISPIAGRFYDIITIRGSNIIGATPASTTIEFLGLNGRRERAFDARHITSINESSLQFKFIQTPAILEPGVYQIRIVNSNGSSNLLNFTVLASTTTPTQAPVITFSANRTSLVSGQTAILQWSATNATSCDATAGLGFSTNRAISGIDESSNLSGDTTFTISCTGPGGTSERSTRVLVAATIPTPAPAPIITFNANQNPVPNGQSTTLVWSAVNATSCTAITGAGFSTSGTISGSDASSALTAPTIFTIACTGAGGTNIASVTVSVANAAAPAPTVTFSVNQTPIPNGGTAIISWNSTNATSCTAIAGPGFSTDGMASGSHTTIALTSNTTFTVRCSGPGGTTDRSVQVVVAAPIPFLTPAPVITFNAEPTSVLSGERTMLHWSATNATSCTEVAGLGFRTGEVASGRVWSNPLSGDTTFIISCTGHGGTTTASVIVRVTTSATTPAPTPAPIPTATLTANQNPVPHGGQVILTWHSTNATRCIATHGPGFNTGDRISGNSTITNLTSTTTFAIQCTNAEGRIALQSVVVNVSPPAATTPAPAPVITTFTASPNPVPFQGITTLTWSSANTTSCTAQGGPGFDTGGRVSGSDTSTALSGDTPFAISCTGPGGTTTASVTVGHVPFW